MGSKFCNLNVYGGALSAVEALCPELMVRAAVPGWITAVHGSYDDMPDWNAARKTAQRISKALACPVLLTWYFDDDFTEFSVYQNGRRAAQHIPAGYEGCPRTAGSSRVWARLFDLPEESEKTLRTVFKETSPELSLRLLECVLGCPLWVVAEALDSVKPPEKSLLQEYLARKASESRIKNAAKLTLLDEQEGSFRCRTYPVFREEEGSEKQPFWMTPWEETSERRSFWVIRNGALKKLFEKELPGVLIGTEEGKNCFWATCLYKRTGELETHVYTFSYEGELLEHWIKDKTATPPDVVFSDEDRPFLQSFCPLSGERFAARGRKDSVSYLLTCRPGGLERRTLRIPVGKGFEFPAAYGDGLLFATGSVLACYDTFLEKRWSVELEGVECLRIDELDELSDILYLNSRDRMISFDLKTRQVRAERKLGDLDDCYMEGVLPGVGPIMITGESGIQVWNANLTLISRHRTKGSIMHLLHQDGRNFLLTNVERTAGVSGMAAVKEGRLRLYELTMQKANTAAAAHPSNSRRGTTSSR